MCFAQNRSEVGSSNSNPNNFGTQIFVPVPIPNFWNFKNSFQTRNFGKPSEMKHLEKVLKYSTFFIKFSTMYLQIKQWYIQSNNNIQKKRATTKLMWELNPQIYGFLISQRECVYVTLCLHYLLIIVSSSPKISTNYWARNSKLL